MALRQRTGEQVWSKQLVQWQKGATITRNNGEYQAYSADEGKLLWSFQTGAGANDTGTIFTDSGKQ